MTFECHRSTSQPKSFRNTRAVFCWGVWLCCGEKRNQSAASTDADHRHQPSAIRHQPVLISDYQSKITAASGAVLKTHGKKQPNQHQPSLYKSHQAGGQILERLSLQLYLSVCLCFSGHHFRMMKSEPPAPTPAAAWSRHVPTDTKSGVVAGPHRKSSP